MHLTRTQPEVNVHRYYRIQIVCGLFDEWGLVREWGRIGRSGTVRTDWFYSRAEVEQASAKLHERKLKRGYM